MTEQEIAQKAREALIVLRDAVREGRQIDFRERDPLMLTVFAAIDTLDTRASLAPAGQGEAVWIVSVVMVKHGPSVVNTQNKLYELCAANRDEAQRKAIRVAQSDFPEHYLHTVCGMKIRAATPSSPAPQESSAAEPWRVERAKQMDSSAAPDKGEVAKRIAAKVRHHWGGRLINCLLCSH